MTIAYVHTEISNWEKWSNISKKTPIYKNSFKMFWFYLWQFKMMSLPSKTIVITGFLCRQEFIQTMITIVAYFSERFNITFTSKFVFTVYWTAVSCQTETETKTKQNKKDSCPLSNCFKFIEMQSVNCLLFLFIFKFFFIFNLFLGHLVCVF